MKWAKVIITIWIFLDIGTWAIHVGHPEMRPEIITGGSWFLAFALAVIVIIGLWWERDKWWDFPKTVHDKLCLICPEIKKAERIAKAEGRHE